MLTEFSNRYYFDGGAPTDDTKWGTLATNVVSAEQPIYQAPSSGGATIVGAVGYEGGSEIPVFSDTWGLTGSGAFTSWAACPGDCAAVVRYSTSDRSSKNHPIYCFNYYHSISAVAGAGNEDLLHAAQKSAMSLYAADWITGFSDGSVTHHRSRPNGSLCTGELVLPMISHRDLPR